jgi:TP901 family phage tail tape measure protein
MASNKYAVETAFHLIDKATESLNKIGVKGNAVGKALKKDFMRAQDQLASLGKAAGKAALAIGAAGVAAAGAFAVKGVKDAIEFNTAFTKVSTVADTTKVSLDQLNRGLIEVSNQTGIAATELANMQYDAIVSGISTADSIDFLSTAVKASKASFSETGTVIDSLTKVINAYGLEASEAQKIAGQMLITNNLGKTSFDALNSSLGKVLPTAARLNVGTDELFASLTALTANSIETPKAVKGLEKILETVQRPTDAAARAARRLGIDFSVSAIRSKGLSGFLKDIQEKTGGSEEAIMSLFGSVESLNAITVLTGKGAGQFADALEQMQNAAGAVDTAFNKVMKTPAERWARIMNKIKNAGINLGTALLPMVEKVMGKVEEFTDKLKDYDFTPVAGKIGVVFDKIFQAGQFFVWLVGVAWKLRVPIIAVAAAVAIYRGGMLVAAAAVNAFTAAQNIAKGVQLVAALITGNQTKAMALYKAGTMGATAQTTLFWVRQKAVSAFNFAGTIIKQGAAFVALKAQLIGAKVATVAYSVAQKACAAATAIMNGAMTIANTLFVASPIGWIVLAIGALIAVIVLCAKNWDKITAALQVAWEWIKNVAGIIWDGLCNAFNALTGFIQRNSEKVLAFITIFYGPFGFIISIVKELKDNWGAVVEAFKTDGIIAGLKKLGGVILSGILAPIQGFLEMLSKIPIIGEKIAPAADKIKEFRDQLKGVETENTVVQNIVPGSITNPVPETLTQTVNTTARIVPPLNNGINNRTITAAATAPGGASFPGETAPVPPQLNRVTPPAITRTGMAPIPAPQVDPVTIRVGKVEGLNEQLRGLTADVTLVENVVPGKINSVTPPIVDQPRRVTASPAMPSFSGVNLNNRTITAAATAPTPPMTTAEQYYYTEKTSREQVDIGIRTEPGTTATIARQPRSPNVRVFNAGGNNAR